MVLVAVAAILMAMLFLLFKVFDRREIPLLPAIGVNYVVAMIAGLCFAPPWRSGDLTGLWWPALGMGLLFVVIFNLTGLSAQRAGVAATTVASRMSLVLTVIAAVWLYDEKPGTLGWLGIAVALASVALASMVKGAPGARGAWKLPVLIFFGNAAIDISLNWMQRMHLTPETEAAFPTLIFIPTSIIAILLALYRCGTAPFKMPGVWIGGILLGLFNYASLVAILQALAYGGLPSSSLYPLMNVGVILIGSIASVILFREPLRSMQVVGIGLAIVALVLIINA